jgi:hypothetical protein
LAALPGRALKENRRSRREFETTLTDERAIAPAARAGFRVIPKTGKSAPIATGIRTTL